MPRDEADGPLAPHLRAIGKDECIYDDSDVYAVLQAAARIEELEYEVKRLHRKLFLSANVINSTRVLVEAGYDRRLNEYKAAFGKVERALLVYDNLTKNVSELVA